MIVAIDGPAGSGKSTVSKLLAEQLGLLYIDTGAMYRALTLKALRENIDLKDEEALVALARSADITLRYDRVKGARVELDGQDVSEAIRTPELTARVWYVAQIPRVRAVMVLFQRTLASQATQGVVLEGRDIGTVVFPDADFKFYLDADFDVRVQRRYQELACKKKTLSVDEVKKDLETRDHKDMTRKVGALKKTPQTITVDTTNMSIDEVVRALARCIQKAR